MIVAFLIAVIFLLIAVSIVLFLRLIGEQQLNEDVSKDNDKLAIENINLIAKIAKLKNQL